MSFLNMLLPYYQGRTIKDRAIDRNLIWKTFQGIGITFYLIAMQIAVDHGYINATNSMAQA
jgi:hypothetical protein